MAQKEKNEIQLVELEKFQFVGLISCVFLALAVFSFLGKGYLVLSWRKDWCRKGILAVKADQRRWTQSFKQEPKQLKDKRAKKLAQHYGILCNHEKVKILKYRIGSKFGYDSTLEIVTKMPNPLLSNHEVVFEIADGEATLSFSCIWVGELHQYGLRKYWYRIL